MLKIHANFNEGADVVEGMGKQLPFAVARTLTGLAQDGQEAGRQEEKSGIFRLRNDWTVRNTKITPATKANLLSEVYTDTENRSTGAPDYLVRQEDGGERMPFGRKHIAIPTRYLRRLVRGIIPKALRPEKLLPRNANMGQQFTGKLGRVGKAATPYPRTERQHKALSQGEYVAFLQKTKSGTLCIFVRHGGITYKGASDAEPWYTLVTHAQVRKRFHLDEDVQKAVDANLQKRWDVVIAETFPLNI